MFMNNIRVLLFIFFNNSSPKKSCDRGQINRQISLCAVRLVGSTGLDNSTNRVFPLVSDGCSATSAKKADQSTGARNERTGVILLFCNLSITQCSRAALEQAGTLLIMT